MRLGKIVINKNEWPIESKKQKNEWSILKMLTVINLMKSQLFYIT